MCIIHFVQGFYFLFMINIHLTGKHLSYILTSKADEHKTQNSAKSQIVSHFHSCPAGTHPSRQLKYLGHLSECVVVITFSGHTDDIDLMAHHCAGREELFAGSCG